MARRPSGLQYRAIPSAPTLSSPVTYVPGDRHVPSNSFLYSSHGGVHNLGRDVIFDGAFSSGVTLNDWAAFAPPSYRIVNAIGAVFGDAALADHAIDDVNGADYWEWWGRDPANPILCRSLTQNGVQLSSRIGGSHHIIRNMVVDTPGSSGMTANYGTSSAMYYASLDIDNFRVIGYTSGAQEGIYIGHTSSGYDYIQNLSLTNFLAIRRGREGIQLGHINNATVSNFTCIDVGKGGTSQQTNLMQWHDNNGVMQNGILDTAPNPFNIFTHGSTFRNILFRWTGAKGFIGDIATGSYFAGSPRANGQPVLFDGCYFWKDSVGTDVVADWAETGCNIEFRNSGFSSNITGSILGDIRGGSPSNTKTGTTSTNGNFTQSFAAPVYMSQVYSDYITHGLVTSPFYYNLGMGFRTK